MWSHRCKRMSDFLHMVKTGHWMKQTFLRGEVWSMAFWWPHRLRSIEKQQLCMLQVFGFWSCCAARHAWPGCSCIGRVNCSSPTHTKESQFSSPDSSPTLATRMSSNPIRLNSIARLLPCWEVKQSHCQQKILPSCPIQFLITTFLTKWQYTRHYLDATCW